MTDSGEYHAKQPQYAKVPAELLHNLEIKDGAIRLYAHMQWRYGRNKKNYEGYRSIAECLGVSKTTIGNRIKELAYFDWLVVIDRDYDKKSGNWRTPYYHLFESQKDCRQFRETYQPQDGEMVRAQPTDSEISKRKSRKGIGGNPDHLLNSSSAGALNSSSAGALNSSSAGALNSSSAKPVEHNQLKEQPVKEKDSLPTGSSNNFSIESQYGVGVGDDWLAAYWKSKGIKPVPEYPHWDYKEHIIRSWGKSIAGMAGWITGQVLGTATRGQWKEFKFDDPARPEELYAFIYWWRTTNTGMDNPTKAETIRIRFDQFRGVKDYGMLCGFYKDWLQNEALREYQKAHTPPVETNEAEQAIHSQAEIAAVIAGVCKALSA